jgi:WD40 repeat protein
MWHEGRLSGLVATAKPSAWALMLILGSGASAAEPPTSPATEFENTSRLLVPLPQEPRSAAVSTDGALLATGQADGSIVVWNVSEERPLRRLAGHTGSVDVLAFHPREPQLASAGGDHTVRLWNANTGESLHILQGHTRRVTAICFSSDDKWLLTGGYDKTSRLWNLEDVAAAPLSQEHTAAVCSVALSADGERFATGSLAGELRLWSRTGEPVTPPIKAHQGAVGALVFNAQSRGWISGGDDGHVVVWDAASGEQRERLSEVDTQPLATSPVTRIAVSSDGNLLAIGDQNGAVRTWNLTEKLKTSEFEGHQDEICGLAFHATARSLVTTGRDRAVREWPSKLPISPRLAAIDGAEARLWAVAIAPADASVYAGGRDGFVAEWSLATGERTRTLAGFKGTIDSIAVSPDGSQVACCGWKSKTAVVFQAASPDKPRQLPAEANARCVRFHPDGKTLVVGLEDGAILIWPAEGDKPRRVSTGSQAVYDISFSPDGKQAATCCGDWRQPVPGAITFWNTETWSEIRKVNEHTRAVRSVAFNPAGTRLASTGDDGLVILWHGESHLPVSRFQNAAGARSIAFSPDGSRLAVGLHDGTINVWDAGRGELVQRFRCDDDVFALAYTTDGSAIVSASGEKRVEIWPGMEPVSTSRRIQKWVDR